MAAKNLLHSGFSFRARKVIVCDNFIQRFVDHWFSVKSLGNAGLYAFARSLASWLLQQFAAAGRAELLHLRRASRAKRAFIRADVCFVIDRKRPTAFFARNPHFERHAAPCPRRAFQVNWIA